MREIFIAVTMLSVPAAATLVVGKTAWMTFAADRPDPVAVPEGTELESLGEHAEAAEAFAVHCAACHGRGELAGASPSGDAWHPVPVASLDGLAAETKARIATYLDEGTR